MARSKVKFSDGLGAGRPAWVQARVDAGISQRQMAAMLGETPVWLNHIEQGRVQAPRTIFAHQLIVLLAYHIDVARAAQDVIDNQVPRLWLISHQDLVRSLERLAAAPPMPQFKYVGAQTINESKFRGIPTFEQFRLNNAEKFKLTLENSAIEESIKNEILSFINSWPVNDFYWDIFQSINEGFERWGDDFGKICSELGIHKGKDK